MNNEAAERAHERRERAEDRQRMQNIISTVIMGFLSSQMEKSRKNTVQTQKQETQTCHQR